MKIKRVSNLAIIIFLSGGFILTGFALVDAAYTPFDKDVVLIFTEAIEFLLRIAGGLALLMLVVGGVYYMLTGSNPDGQKKAKRMISYVFFGLIFILASYSIINQTSEIGTGVMVAPLPTCHWDCADWSVCAAGSQTRTCTETCGAVVGSPLIVRGCVAIPASFDWSHVVLPLALPAGGNWMTNVKDQGGCGSCWAFATLGYVEAVYNIEQSDATLDKDLSEQDLVSCSSGNCTLGGNPVLTAKYIQETGVVPNACFLYSASDETCTVPNRCVTWAAQLWTVGNWFILPTSDQASIKNELVNGGPVLAVMNMSTWNVGTESCTSSVENHAVVIVGYDDVGGSWIVRNSWGAGWIDGIFGYFKVKYGECGLDSGVIVGVENVTSP